MMSDETFNHIKKFNEIVVLLYVPHWLECTYPISATLNDLEFISQLNQFSDTNIVNAVIQKFENHLDYINSSLAAFALFDNRIPLIYKMEYMSREDNHKFKRVDRIINLHDIIISFNLFHILNIDVNHIKMLINNNDASGFGRLGNTIFINAVNDLAERGVATVKKCYPRVNNYTQLNQIVVTSEHERKLHGSINRNILKLL